MSSLNAAQTVFTVFYAMFWGNVADAMPRWKAFSWGHLARAKQRKELQGYFDGTPDRIFMAVLLLNVAPLVILLLSLSAWAENNGKCPETGSSNSMRSASTATGHSISQESRCPSLCTVCAVMISIGAGRLRTVPLR